MTKCKIVIIGAGSASFGPTTLAGIIANPALRGCELALVDLNEATLANAFRVAERMNVAWQAEMSLSASTDRCDVLAGATHVVVSIEVAPREELWRLDWEIPLRHGLRQPYAENGGPGGLMHACRQIPGHLAIAADMEVLCPEAWMIVFSNPLPRIVRAVTKHSRIRAVGKCHQINVGYALAAALLGRETGVDLPPGLTLHSDPANVGTIHQLATSGRERFTIRSAGLNHFIWLLDIRDRRTGEDLYPALRAVAEVPPPGLELLALDLFRIFGRLPIAGDTHMAEYLPWLHDSEAQPCDVYDLPLYDWTGNQGAREALNAMMQSMADGRLPVDGLREAPSEGASELIAALSSGPRYHDETVNVRNGGAISNLPDHAIVEVPAVVEPGGIFPVCVGPLPEPIAELCRREAALVEMVVETAVTGDRTVALQTLLLDPMINDIGRARAILEDYLRTFAPYLPQFA